MNKLAKLTVINNQVENEKEFINSLKKEEIRLKKRISQVKKLISEYETTEHEFPTLRIIKNSHPKYRATSKPILDMLKSGRGYTFPILLKKLNKKYHSRYKKVNVYQALFNLKKKGLIKCTERNSQKYFKLA
jgi:hypothetical protein